jgi:hypothetical protein
LSIKYEVGNQMIASYNSLRKISCLCQCHIQVSTFCKETYKRKEEWFDMLYMWTTYPVIYVPFKQVFFLNLSLCSIYHCVQFITRDHSTLNIFLKMWMVGVHICYNNSPRETAQTITEKRNGTHNIRVDDPRRSTNNIDASFCRDSLMKHATEFYLRAKPRIVQT